jgi:hypothetical protein
MEFITLLPPPPTTLAFVLFSSVRICGGALPGGPPMFDGVVPKTALVELLLLEASIEVADGEAVIMLQNELFCKLIVFFHEILEHDLD